MKMPSHALRHALIATLTLLAASFIGGCKSYQLGSPTELPFKTIYIKPVNNDSYAPQAQVLLSASIREAFIEDGRTQIVTNEEDADVVLLVNITEYRRIGAARQSVDTRLSSSFDLILESEISLFNQNKGDYYFIEREVFETTNAFIANPYADPAQKNTQGFLQSEYNSMPRLTRDLARKIADEVLSPWEPR